MIILFALVGVFIGLAFHPRAKNQVMKIIPRDRRFVDFNIARENAFSVECEEQKGFPPQRFIKFRAGFSGTVGRFLKRSITRFIGREGTAYTWRTETLGGARELKSPKFIGTLADALKGLWGLEFYDTIPEDKKDELEESTINVTVDISNEDLTPENSKSVSEEDIKREEDRLAAETFWKGKKEVQKSEWTQWIFIFIAGMGAALLLAKLFGWM